MSQTNVLTYYNLVKKNDEKLSAVCNNLKYVIAFSAITHSSEENMDSTLQGSRSTSLCMISGIHHCVNEKRALLGFYAV